MLDIDPLSGLRQLVSELTRRRVVHAVAVYGVVAWVVVQVANVAFPALYVPREWLTGLVFLAVLGFPVTVALAWAFEITDEGVRRTPQLAEGQGLSPALRGFFAACVVAATAGLGWVGWETWLSPRAGAVSAAASPGGAGPDAAGRADSAERAALSPSSVAVLYFEDTSPGDSLAAFADGLTENLIDRLSQVEGLEVISRRGVRPYRGRSVPLDSVARALGAGSLVEGSVRGSGDTLAVTVRLIDGRTAAQMLSETLARPAGDLFELEEALAREVAGLLRRRIGPEVQLAAWQSRASSVEAWRRVHQADRLREEADSLEDAGHEGLALQLLADADTLLARAAELDPDWNAPETLRAALALVRVDPNAAGWGEAEREEIRRAIGYADRALEEAPSDAEALRIRGRLRTWLALKADDADRAAELMDAAESDLRAAVREDPGSAKALLALSDLLLDGRGKFREALYYAERAREADAYLRIPESTQFQLFNAAVNVPDWEAARRWCLTGQRAYPDNLGFWSCELTLLASEGAGPADPDRAWRVADEVVRRTPDAKKPFYRAISRRQVAAALARAGRADSARSVLRRARRDSPAAGDEPFLYYEEAHVHLLLGEEERALELVGRFAEQYPGYRAILEGDPWMAPLRDRPRYRELLAGGD